jgi:hypothetical protein
MVLHRPVETADVFGNLGGEGSPVSKSVLFNIPSQQPELALPIITLHERTINEMGLILRIIQAAKR